MLPVLQFLFLAYAVLLIMLNTPAANILDKTKTILLAGAGGYDLDVGLPLYFALRAATTTPR